MIVRLPHTLGHGGGSGINNLTVQTRAEVPLVNPVTGVAVILPPVRRLGFLQPAGTDTPTVLIRFTRLLRIPQHREPGFMNLCRRGLD